MASIEAWYGAHRTHRIRMTIKRRVFFILVVVVDFEDASNNIQIPCYGPFDIINRVTLLFINMLFTYSY